MVAIAENVKAHNKAYPNCAPALVQVVTVPGPIKAAEMMDQNKTLEDPFLKEMNLGI